MWTDREIHEMLERIDNKVDRVNEHLLKYTKISTQNQQDLKWVKGGIKIAFAGLFALLSGSIAVCVHFFSGK